MSTFYAGQLDYIAQLNSLAAAVGMGALTANRVVITDNAGILATTANLSWTSGSATLNVGGGIQIGTGIWTSWAGAASASIGNSFFFGTLTGTGQVGTYSILVQSSGGTSTGYSVQSRVDTAAAAFTLTEAAAFFASNPSLGAGSAISTYNGFYCANITGPGAVVGFHSAVTPGSNRFAFYDDGGATNYILGRVAFANTPTNYPGSQLSVAIHPTTISGGWQVGVHVQSSLDAAATGGDMFRAYAAFTANNQNIYGLNVVSADGSFTGTVATGVLVDSGWGAQAVTAYGFRGLIARAANKYNLYLDGTALNFLRGNTAVGANGPQDGIAFYISTASGDTTGASQYGVFNNPTFSTAATSEGIGIYSAPATVASAFTQSYQAAFLASSVKGAGSTITTWVGYDTHAITTGDTTIGFRGVIAAGTNRYNLYMGGTAWNYLAGNTSIGGVGPVADRFLYIGGGGNTTGSGQYGIVVNMTSSSSCTAENFAYYGAVNTAAASYTLAEAAGFVADNATLGGGSAITNLYGFLARNLTAGGVNAGFVGLVASGANKYNLYMSGSASNYLAGTTLIGSTQNDLRLGQTLGVIASANASGIAVTAYSATGSDFGLLDLSHVKSNTLGARTAVASNDALGQIMFRGADGTNITNGAFIQGFCDGTVAAGQVPGRIEFHTYSAAGADQTVLTLDKAKLATFTGGILVNGGQYVKVSYASAAGVNQVVCENSDNTNAASHAIVYAITGGSSAGDPSFTWTVTGAQSYIAGIDNSVTGDPFVASVGTALGTNNWLSVNSSGVVTLFTNSRATVDLTAQGSAIGSTLLYAVPASDGGMYEITYVATVTRAATTSSTLGGSTGFQIDYTDLDTSVSKLTPQQGAPTAGANQSYGNITNQGNTTATMISGCIVVYAAASTNINYRIGYTSSGATSMQYNLHIKIRKVQ